jgi:MoxR-like ATPase
MKLDKIKQYVENRIIGQKNLIDNMLVCLIAGGHMLIEGMPGLAKTTATKSLAESIDAKFKRIQFTPDLLPSDITGSDVFIRESDKFEFHAGPIFNNIILADEVNRAPAKVQSALLEAMGEGQVTIGLNTYRLPELFMVVATQNPIEQEGTYNLPEAQMDRFMMKVVLDHPTFEEELEILRLEEGKRKDHKKESVTVMDDIFHARKLADDVYVDEKIEKYIVSIVMSTREAAKYSQDIANLIRYGASPRASIALLKCSKALALLQGQDYVAPHHVQQLAYEILRHRIIPSFEAEADNISTDDIITQILQVVAVA